MKVIKLMGLNWPDELDCEMNKWYDEHVELVKKHPGVISATRFKIHDREKEFFGNYPKYLTVYEFKDEAALFDYERSKEAEEVRAQARRCWPDGAPYFRKWRVTYNEL